MSWRWLFVVLVVANARAATLSESFSTNSHYGSGSTWDLVAGQLQLPFAIDRSNLDVSEDEDDYFNPGTGEHGAFDSTTYANFDASATSALVTLDTATVYHFTSFTLDSGVTLKASGSDPLQIKVQGDVVINGTIDLSGEDGESIQADTSVTPAGGSACCGGGAGGAGGSAVSVAQDGTSADDGDTGKGGAGGASGSAPNGSGGGGGGGFETAPNQAAAGTAIGGGGSAGTAGSGYGDVYLDTFVGGSGGGGGGAYTVSTTNESSGGGGGGGGGAIRFEVGGDMNIAASGGILANGGDGGGSADASLEAGGGGGGAGGAIVLFVAGTLTNDGTLEAKRGAGGSGSDGGAGGQGAYGRTRYVDQTNTWTAGGGAVEDPFPNMATFGRVYRSKQSTQIFSNTYDLLNSSPTFTGVTTTDTTPAGTTVSYAFFGSNDNFASSSSAVSDASMTDLNGYRYLKMRVTLQTTDRDTTPSVSAIEVAFTEREETEFQFGLTSCAQVGRQSNVQGAGWGAGVWLLLLLSIPRVVRPLIRGS